MEKPQEVKVRAFTFALRIVKLAAHLENRSNVGRLLGQQLLRAGTSVGANMEEAHAGQSRADFVSKCAIALKEAREAHYWLRLIAASDIVAADRVADLVTEADELMRIIAAIIVSTKRNDSINKERRDTK